MKDYSMYRYFKGEEENPFEAILDTHGKELTADYLQKLHIANKYWFYENYFDEQFSKNESSDWYAFFGGSHDSKASKKFMKLLSEEDYERTAEKKKGKIFDLWLYEYLFPEKLCEYGSMDDDIKDYLSTSAQQLQGL